jgi:hypothetical protein
MVRVIIESMDITYSKMTNCFKSIGGYVFADTRNVGVYVPTNEGKMR